MGKDKEGQTKFDDQEEQEVDDAATDDTNPEGDDPEPKSEEDTDTDEGTEDKDATESDGETDDEAGETDGEAGGKEEVDPRDQKIAELEAKVEEVLKKTKPEQEQEKAPQKRVYTDEEKAQISDIAKVPFETVQFFDLMMQNALSQVRVYVEGQLGEINKSSAIEQFSKNSGFSDAVKYRAGMEEYLSKLPANLRSKQEHLETAYHVARSKGLKSTMQKVVQSKDKNKRIVTVGRPKGGDSTGKKSVSLTDDEISMAKAAGMSLQEYAQYKRPLRMIK